MAVALLADIHSNLEALEACLAHARSRGASAFAFLGDIVGYGADPQAVVDVVMGEVARGAPAVKGNHDAAACGEEGYLNESARAAVAWSRGVMSEAQAGFLRRLPLIARDGDACFVHASAHSPQRWTYVDSAGEALRSAAAAGAAYTFSGHVHEQVLYGSDAEGRMVAFRPQPGVAIAVRPTRRWLALAGSVGQPRDGNTAAAYALFDREASTLTFHRVPYDVAAAARKVRAAGLPEMLAYRLERGI